MPSECVRVSVRCRPMNSSEKQRGCQKIVVVDHKRMAIEIKKPDAKKESTLVDNETDRQFTFDSVFDDNSLQSEVYEHTAYDLVKQVMQGYNGTIFAYGQTGCGKTFTMEGVRNTTDPELKGIIPTTFQQIFTTINKENMIEGTYKQFLVRTSYIEIYNEEVRDLLSDNPKQRLDIKEDTEKGIYVKNLIQVTVNSIEQIEDLMHKGNNNRSVGATLMNADSSRSHSLFTITIETCEPAEAVGGKDKIRVGKLNLVDLAGSERQSKTQASGQRLKEATKINLSLSALGNVISALVTNSGTSNAAQRVHVPYRDSKLTRLLQDSLGGNTKTVMIAAISPADYNYDETLSTLRYANRAKNIKNIPKINEDPKDALLREYQSEIQRLKELLTQQGIDIAAGGSKQPTQSKSASMSKALPAASSNDSIEDTTSTTMLSPEDANRVTDEYNDLQEDIEHLASEKDMHTQYAQQLEEQMQNEKELRMKLEAEREDIMKQLRMEREKNNSNATSDTESTLLQQQTNIEQQVAALDVDLPTRIDVEKQRHEQLAIDLAQEMDSKLHLQYTLQSQLENQLKELTGKSEEEKTALKTKLDKLQTKVLAGGKKLKSLKLEQGQQQKLLEMERHEKERLMERQRLESQRIEQEKLALTDQYTNQHSELQIKTTKLQTLTQRYQSLKDELHEYTREWENEKEGYLQNIREIYKELRLYKLITESVLNHRDVDDIVSKSIYEEDHDKWILPKIDLPLIFPTIGSKPGVNDGTQQKKKDLSFNSRHEMNSKKLTGGDVHRQPASQSGRLNDNQSAADFGWKRSIAANALDEVAAAGTQTHSSLPAYQVPSYHNKSSTATGTAARSMTPSAPAPIVTGITAHDLANATADLPRRANFAPAASGEIISPTNNASAPRAGVESTAELPKRAAFQPAASAINSPASHQPTQTPDFQADSLPARRAPFQPATASLGSLGSSPSPASALSANDPLAFDISARKSFQPAAAPKLQQPTMTQPNDILSKLPPSRARFEPTNKIG